MVDKTHAPWLNESFDFFACIFCFLDCVGFTIYIHLWTSPIDIDVNGSDQVYWQVSWGYTETGQTYWWLSHRKKITALTHRSVQVREAPPSSGGIHHKHTTNTCKLNIFYRHKCVNTYRCILLLNMLERTNYCMKMLLINNNC